MSESSRPKELHIATVTAVERDALPLLTSMVNGELYAAEMLNMRGLGIINPGIYSGFDPAPKAGLTISVNKDSVDGYGSAVCEVELQQFYIIQQHDVDITLPTGSKWAVVIEPFYEEGVFTKQVDALATNDAASITKVLSSDVTDYMQVICEIDLTSGQTVITEDMIDLSGRSSQTLSVGAHIEDPDAHPQYVRSEELEDKVAELIPDSSTFDLTPHLNDSDPHSQYLKKTELASKVGDMLPDEFDLTPHLNASDPHNQYLKKSALATEVSGMLPDEFDLDPHLNAADPHTQYLKETELASKVGAMLPDAFDLTPHLAATNPHSQYVKNTDLSTKVNAIIESGEIGALVSEAYEFTGDKLTTQTETYSKGTSVTVYTYEGDNVKTSTNTTLGITIKAAFSYTAEGVIDGVTYEEVDV